MKKADQREKDRCDARNRLEEIINEFRKSDELQVVDEGERGFITDELDRLKYWTDGTTKEYLEKIEFLSKIIAEVKDVRNFWTV